MKIIDKGGRRSGLDRRSFSYAIYIPERREEMERRNGIDRRSGKDRRNPEGVRRLIGLDRRKAFKNIILCNVSAIMN